MSRAILLAVFLILFCSSITHGQSCIRAEVVKVEREQNSFSIKLEDDQVMGVKYMRTDGEGDGENLLPLPEFVSSGRMLRIWGDIDHIGEGLILAEQLNECAEDRSADKTGVKYRLQKNIFRCRGGIK